MSIDSDVDPQDVADYSDVRMSIRPQNQSDVDQSTPDSTRSGDGARDVLPGVDVDAAAGVIGPRPDGWAPSELIEAGSEHAVVDVSDGHKLDYLRMANEAMDRERELAMQLGVHDVDSQVAWTGPNRDKVQSQLTREAEMLSSERKAPYPHPHEVLPDFGVDGLWIKDPREDKEPWRRKYKLQQCKGQLDDGTRCTVSVRGSDRCPEHPHNCAGLNKQGEPCGSSALRNSDYCAAHIPEDELQNGKRPLDVDVDPSGDVVGAVGDGPRIAVSERFGTPEMAREAGKLGGQARRYPKLTEAITTAIEAHAEDIVGAGIGALNATKPVVVEVTGRDPNGDRFTRQEVIDFPDHLVQLKAHEALTNRAFGRPHQAVDVNQETRQLSLALDARDPETRDMLHEFLRRRPKVDA